MRIISIVKKMGLPYVELERNQGIYRKIIYIIAPFWFTGNLFLENCGIFLENTSKKNREFISLGL
jgi:hypothetical protein